MSDEHEARKREHQALITTRKLNLLEARFGAMEQQHERLIAKAEHECLYTLEDARDKFKELIHISHDHNARYSAVVGGFETIYQALGGLLNPHRKIPDSEKVTRFNGLVPAVERLENAIHDLRSVMNEREHHDLDIIIQFLKVLVLDINDLKAHLMIK